MDSAALILPSEALSRPCSPEACQFGTTASLRGLDEVLGQPRAVAALEFGTGIASHGFNIFALGLPGSGKTTLIREYLERRAAGQPRPPDLCYVHNFADHRRPAVLTLPSGTAAAFRDDMAALVSDLQDAVPRAFESDAYTAQRDTIRRQFEGLSRDIAARLEKRVAEFGFHLTHTPGGLLLAPAIDGKPLSERELEQLSPEQAEKLRRIREKLEVEVEEGLRHLRELDKSARQALRALDVETATAAVRHLVEDIRGRYTAQPEVLAYLDAVQSDIVEHAQDFRRGPEAEATGLPLPLPARTASPFSRYEVNILVDNGSRAGAPVVIESNPTYYNLTGRIEHQSTWAALVTDFTMIKPGALHRANGGYLILPARECQLNPFAWEGLKRSLKDRVLRIEELGTQLNLISTATLEPETVPLDVKVILIGSPLLYYTLNAYDEDFAKLFKVKAEFANVMARTPEAEHAYALFVSTIAREDGALPFSQEAVARIVEHGARLAGDQEKLSTRLGEIADLVREAAQAAAGNSHGAVTADDVRAAEAARRYRQNLLEERLQQSIAEGSLLIDTWGSAVGRLNGLTMVNLGDYAFGYPARITATVAPGRRGVVSLEREVHLSGPIHGKGVLILGGFLAQTYGQSQPLSLTGSLVFEQSYSQVEGDSASLAELFALLSALAGVPLEQGIAVTGSVNQHGQVQPVGGINEKIEGFFDVCRQRRLTGRQGVLIPRANQRHLMLRDDVIAAVRAGAFNIWAARTVNEGLSLLSGLPAGEQGPDGHYPPRTLHGLVARRLAAFSETLHSDAGAPLNGRQAGSLAPLEGAPRLEHTE
jgi:lon-related putative ATP-dependent protease